MKSVKFTERFKLPREPGIYYAMKGDRILYVGKAKNLRSRWIRHEKIPQLRRCGCTEIRYRIVYGELRRKHYEAVAIKEFDPPLNERNEKTVPIFVFIDSVAEAAYGIIFGGIVLTCFWRWIFPIAIAWLQQKI